MYLNKNRGGQIEGTAVPADVLSGKTFMSANSDKVQVGTMIDKRNQNPDVIALTSRNNYLRCSVPTGYYENSGIDIPLSNLGTVSAANVLSGQTFTSTAGLKQTGTLVLPTASSLKFSSSFNRYGGSDETFIYHFNLPPKNDLYKHFKFEFGGSTSVFFWNFQSGYSGTIQSGKEYNLLDSSIQIEVGLGKSHLPSFNLYLY